MVLYLEIVSESSSTKGYMGVSNPPPLITENNFKTNKNMSIYIYTVEYPKCTVFALSECFFYNTILKMVLSSIISKKVVHNYLA